MDSLTQIALGAAVGEAVAGRRFGRRAAFWGALCGTLPDLDVLVPLGDPVSDFVHHRSASHSLLMLALATPLLVWLIGRLHPDTRAHPGRWAALVYLALASHALLDAFTVYGTQLWWPLDMTPVAWSTIFIIDPAYTLPLLLGVACALFAGRRHGWGRRANALGLAASTLYLAWTLGAKLHVDGLARSSLAAAGLAPEATLSAPAPFNSVLWRVLAVDREHYYEGFHSLLDPGPQITFTRHPRHTGLLEPLAATRPVAQLAWFTRGFYAAREDAGRVLITDLRMGLEPDYVFSFVVGRIANPLPVPVPVERLAARRDFRRLHWVWARILDPRAVDPAFSAPAAGRYR